MLQRLPGASPSVAESEPEGFLPPVEPAESPEQRANRQERRLQDRLSKLTATRAAAQRYLYAVIALCEQDTSGSDPYRVHRHVVLNAIEFEVNEYLKRVYSKKPKADGP